MKKDNYHNIIYLILDWLVILGSVYLSIYTGSIFIYILSIILIGSRMRAFDNLMHEACLGRFICFIHIMIIII